MGRQRTYCYFIEDITGDCYLSVEDPSRDMCPSDVDHIYRGIFEGVYYPVVTTDNKEGKNKVWYFYDEEANEIVTFINDEFSTEDDGEFKLVSEEFLKVKSYWDK
ncbi:hypothetical protein BP422_06090 [Brevibacillus formosus]|uniref:Uncharacterized protein n=2 Tax=Brevibacillus formosus TaxID=54913 RepID=A0A220MDQ7_9BACL|nr:hypothetical protein BP422_06090 [Brevibacillus formosus]